MLESLHPLFSSLPTKQNYFYVIVHACLIPRWHPAWKEVERIKKEEAYTEIMGDSGKAAEGVPPNHILRVCGAYESLCVQNQITALQRAGHNAVLYRKATIYFV